MISKNGDIKPVSKSLDVTSSPKFEIGSANSSSMKYLIKILAVFVILEITVVGAFTNSRSSFSTESRLTRTISSSSFVVPSSFASETASCAIAYHGRKCNMRMGLFSGSGGVFRSASKKVDNLRRESPKFRKVMHRILSKSRSALDSLILWQRKNKRNALAAAAVFFSTILTTNLPNHQRELVSYVKEEHVPSTVLLANNNNLVEKHLSTVRGGGHGINGKNNKALKTVLASTTTSFKQKTGNNQEALVEGTTKTFRTAISELNKYMKGPKSDTLLLLLATALITPLCKQIGTSPILGFLAAGMALGPNALGLISGIHTTETLAELGIVFFLFEMGIELSFDRLISMRKDVFGLGLSQFLATAIAVAGVGSLFNIPANALVVLGGGIALSSSAFVLQLLKDKNQLATRFGKASFGVLLFQDLAVVPLLVVTPILAGGGQGLASALSSALLKATMALGSIAFAGRVLLNPMFKLVAQSNSQEAFLGVILLTVLSMSFMTEGLGLSNTLGAFLAGVLLSETKYRYQIEADIAPFRGILLGLFFVTVGFEIDFNLIASNLPLVGSIVAGILFIKAAVLTLLSLAFGLSLSTSQQTGLILSQSGEFAFVAFGLARNLGILDPATTKLMLTSVALTMAVTPFLADVGGKISKRLEEGTDFTHYLGQDRDANEIKESDDFVVVVGYGTVGKVVCDLLDQKFIRYVGLEINPNKAIEARNKGLPVFYGDIGRPEVAEAFSCEKAKAIIVTIADKNEANRAVISLRRSFPKLKIFARAKDSDHAERLQNTLDVVAMVPVVPEDNVLLTLPFGGAVLRSLGAPQEEVNAILEGKRKEILQGRGMAEDEERMVLAQLGILTKPKNEENASAKESNEEEKPPKSALEIAEEKKAKNPMVAQAIEANVVVDKPKAEVPLVVDTEIDDESIMNASNEDSNEDFDFETSEEKIDSEEEAEITG